VLSALAALSPDAEARRVRTRMTPPKENGTADHSRRGDDVIIVCDSLPGENSHYLKEVACAGFDKTSSNGMESFFVLNSSDRNLEEVELELVYYDMQGRQLHRRLERISIDIPAGDTRKVDIKTWDTQRSFHYYKSNRPLRRTSTPFDVRLTLRSLTLKR